MDGFIEDREELTITTDHCVAIERSRAIDRGVGGWESGSEPGILLKQTPFDTGSPC